MYKRHIEPYEPILTIEEALTAASFVSKQKQMTRGDWKKRLEESTNRAKGTTVTGGQDHFYLEGQISLAVPNEGGVHVYCSTQHPPEVQHAIAQILGWPNKTVTVEVRR